MRSKYEREQKGVKMIIHIYGASGSGTSTLGRKICEELGYHFMDTDDYFWLPTNPRYTVKREKSERLRLMREEMESKENVVISGSLVGWGDELIPFFDLVIRLMTDTKVRIERLKKREREKFGERIAPGGDMYEHHLDFLAWAEEYDTGSVDMRSKANHDKWQQLLQCPQIVLNGAGDLDENFRIVREKIEEMK